MGELNYPQTHKKYIKNGAGVKKRAAILIELIILMDFQT